MQVKLRSKMSHWPKISHRYAFNLFVYLLIMYDFSRGILIHYWLFNIQFRKDIDLNVTKIYYSSLKKKNKEAAIDCVQLDVIDQLSSEFGSGTLLG